MYMSYLTYLYDVQPHRGTLQWINTLLQKWYLTQKSMEKNIFVFTYVVDICANHITTLMIGRAFESSLELFLIKYAFLVWIGMHLLWGSISFETSIVSFYHINAYLSFSIKFIEANNCLTSVMYHLHHSRYFECFIFNLTRFCKACNQN